MAEAPQASETDIALVISAFNQASAVMEQAGRQIDALQGKQQQLTKTNEQAQSTSTKLGGAIGSLSTTLDKAERAAAKFQQTVLRIAALAAVAKSIWEVVRANNAWAASLDETRAKMSTNKEAADGFRATISRTADEMVRLGEITEEQANKFKAQAAGAGFEGLKDISEQMRAARGDFDQGGIPKGIVDSMLDQLRASMELHNREAEILFEDRKITATEYFDFLRASQITAGQDQITALDENAKEALARDKLTAQERLDIQQEFDTRRQTLTTQNELAVLNIERQGEMARKQIRQQQIDATANMFGMMADAALAFGKEGFIAYKAFAIAQTVISTYSAAMKAYESLASIPYVGVVLGAAAAAAVVAFGVAQISKIASAQPGFAEGGLIPGAPSATDNRVAMVATGEFVIPAHRVQQYGVGIFEAFRQGMLPGGLGFYGPPPLVGSHSFQAGGLVGAAAGVDASVNVGFLNSREEYRRFQRGDGTKIVVDQLRRRSNMIR